MTVQVIALGCRSCVLSLQSQECSGSTSKYGDRDSTRGWDTESQLHTMLRHSTKDQVRVVSAGHLEKHPEECPLQYHLLMPHARGDEGTTCLLLMKQTSVILHATHRSSLQKGRSRAMGD